SREAPGGAAEDEIRSAVRAAGSRDRLGATRPRRGAGGPLPRRTRLPVQRNTPLNPDTIRRDVLKPLMEEIGAPGLGFHALRHSYASLQLASGVNVLQLSRVLGHHSPAFTPSVYTHLLPGDE